LGLSNADRTYKGEQNEASGVCTLSFGGPQPKNGRGGSVTKTSSRSEEFKRKMVLDHTPGLAWLGCGRVHGE